MIQPILWQAPYLYESVNSENSVGSPVALYENFTEIGRTKVFCSLLNLFVPQPLNVWGDNN